MSQSTTRSINHQLGVFQKSYGPDLKIRDILPKLLKEILTGRRSCKVQKTKQFFLKYIDNVYRAPGEELWEDLLKTKRYFDLHILLFDKHRDKSDDTPLTFYHAELPEIMMEMVKQSFSSDFFIGSAKMRCVPSLAINIMTSFLYLHSETFLLVSDRLFRDSEYTLERVSLGALQDKLTWFDKLAMVQFYGAASHTRVCAHFLRYRTDIVYELCTMIYHGMEMIEEKLRNSEINWQNETLACSLTTFRDDEDLVLTSMYLGMYTMNHSITCLRNLLASVLTCDDRFRVMGEVIMRAKVLEHFPYIVKHVLMWFEPGLCLNTLLTSISHCLKFIGAVEGLFMDNLSQTLEHKLPVGIETFGFWNHETRSPNTIAWFFLHSFCFNKKLGSNWCICILCHVLMFSEQAIVDKIVGNFGLDLMDLAHVVEITFPRKVSVQSVILEALLRSGRVQHKVYDYDDIFEGEVKLPENLKEFILEAALFCKKAQCEAKMSLEVKQKLIVEADKTKDLGNSAFKCGNYMEAIVHYTDAISLCPLSARKKQALYYSNRAECHLRNKNPKRAIHDCNRSLCLDATTKVKVQWRRSRAYQKLNLDYPAWLDLKCLEKDWVEQSGVDYAQLLDSLGLQVGILPKKTLSSLDRRIWNAFFHNL